MGETIQELRQTIRSMERAIAPELLKELQLLHHKYGYSSSERLVTALRAARRGLLLMPDAGQGPAKIGRHYTKKTVAVRARFLELNESGRTISEIAAALNISTKSVTDMRAEYGLSKPRKRRSSTSSQ